MDRIQPISDLQSQAKRIIDQVRATREPVVITQRGRPAAIILISVVVGGLIVLQAVNDNLGLFLSKSLGTIVFAWFRDCPLLKLFKRKKGLALSSAATSSSTASASLSFVERTANTLEERVSLIESHIRELREKITVTNYELHQKIDVVKSELIQSISSNQSALGHLAAKIESATVGGFKQQAFGVLLAISGTVISFFA